MFHVVIQLNCIRTVTSQHVNGASINILCARQSSWQRIGDIRNNLFPRHTQLRVKLKKLHEKTLYPNRNYGSNDAAKKIGHHLQSKPLTCLEAGISVTAIKFNIYMYF
jgi:hypothetical protein